MLSLRFSLCIVTACALLNERANERSTSSRRRGPLAICDLVIRFERVLPSHAPGRGYLLLSRPTPFPYKEVVEVRACSR